MALHICFACVTPAMPQKTNKLDMLDELEMVPHCSLAGKPVYIMEAL